MATGTSYAKEADKLAREVRALGLTCESPDGHAYVVTDADGVELAAFPTRPSHVDWRGRALSALRKANIVVAANGDLAIEVTPQANAELMDRLGKLSGDPEARTEFLKAAIEAIDEAHARGEYLDVDQFGAQGGGKTPPLDVARASLQQILAKGGTKKAKAFNRWAAILRLIDARSMNGGSGAGAEPEPEQAPEPEPAGEKPAGAVYRTKDGRWLTDADIEQYAAEAMLTVDVEALRGEAQTAEQLMHEAEERRKAEQERADRLESQNRVLKERVKDAERIASEAQDEARKVKNQGRGWKAQMKKAQREAASAFEALSRERAEREEEAKVDEPAEFAAERGGPEVVPEAEATLAGLGSLLRVGEAVREQGGFRDELGTYLLQLLGTTEYQESPPQWLLDRIDRLAGI